MTQVLVVLCACPDAPTARRLACGLVEQGLAACVNILPEIRSIYRWQGETRDEAETLLIAKTTARAWGGLENWLREHHPYEVPEVLALPVQAGASDYLDWVLNETGSE
jgi:periplasmic divalent cation tolerance protein